MKYIVSRLLWLPVVLLLVSSATFLTLRIVPGDPIDLLATQQLNAEEMARVRQEWGLDKPISAQYVAFLKGLVRGDLGISMTSGVPVKRMLFQRLPPTIELAVVAIIISTILGVGAGIISSVTNSQVLDASIRALATLGFSMPWFWIAIMLIVVFSVELGWLPVSGRISGSLDYETITNFMLIDHIITGNWEALVSFLKHLALPALAIGLTSAGFVSRLTRATMLEILQQNYVRAARARGLRQRTVLAVHALRNALLPIITMQGLQLGALLGGAVITEMVFSWPGAGRLLIDAILRRDYPVVQGTVIAIAFFYVITNMAVDLLYYAVDPRLRRE